MFDVLRRIARAALFGAFIAIAPSEVPLSRGGDVPRIVLAIGTPTPSLAIRPR